MDGFRALGGVMVDSQSGVRFGREPTVCGATVTALGIDEHDLRATYDPVANS